MNNMERIFLHISYFIIFNYIILFFKDINTWMWKKTTELHKKKKKNLGHQHQFKM